MFRPQIACVMTALTLAGVNGIERKRTPVASNTALAIAEGMFLAMDISLRARQRGFLCRGLTVRIKPLIRLSFEVYPRLANGLSRGGLYLTR